MSQQQILGSIAKALGRPTPSTVTESLKYTLPPRAIDHLDEAGTLEAFRQAFVGINGRFFRVENWNEAVEQIRKIFMELNIRPEEAAAWDVPELAPLWETFPEIYRGGDIGIIAGKKLGITWTHGAIAETGTLALLAGPQSHRGTSVLPPVHLSLFSRRELVKSLGEAFDRLGSKDFRALNFITGPSRTSDIEMDLTIGVHGPAVVLAIYVENVD
ncbi:hypothetical protein GJ688_19105 [Heliobacillus mobilis]|uniref:LUD domain-containing protein n=1 Tax=Heliobacterium mobile TaxID=28064 RepID=A0A6I3SPN6_HELMO|nr:lactate utilization protein [Heliobacterium mobile]MTV51023.1 hypothetical protein [Heliobacterium mobile]